MGSLCAVVPFLWGKEGRKTLDGLSQIRISDWSVEGVTWPVQTPRDNKSLHESYGDRTSRLLFVSLVL